MRRWFSLLGIALALSASVGGSPAIAAGMAPADDVTATAGNWIGLASTIAFSGSLAGGASVDITIPGVPAGATAWLTVSDSSLSKPGTVSVFTAGTTPPPVPTIAFVVGQRASNTAAVVTSVVGTVTLRNTSVGAVTTRVDVSGYYVAGSPTNAGTFAVLSPTAVASALTLPANSSTDIPVSAVVSASAGTLLADVSITAPTAAGVLTAFPSGTPPPDTQSLAFSAGRPMSTLDEVAVGSNGAITVANSAAVPVVLSVAVEGYFVAGSPTTAGATTVLPPTHFVSSATVPAHGTTSFAVDGVAGVPAADVTAVVLQLSASGATITGYLSTYALGDVTGTVPAVYFSSGPVTSQLAVVPISATGQIAVHNSSSSAVQLRADVLGYVSGVTAASSVAITVDPTTVLGTWTPGEYGLSFEYSAFTGGKINPTPALINLMRNLGPGILRLGGNSLDNQATSGPTPAQLTALASVLAQTGWRVLYGIDLGHFDPNEAAQEVLSVMAAVGPQVFAFACGNEPNDYVQFGVRPAGYTVSQYLSEVAACYSVVQANAPGVPLDGPDTTKGQWVPQYLANKPTGLAELTQHLYPFNACNTSGITPAQVLSLANAQRSTAFMSTESALAVANGVAFRVSEGSSVGCGGVKGVSNAYPAALWSADTGLAAAENGADGIELHQKGGDSNCSGYSAICMSSSAKDYAAKAPYYGMLLDDQLGAGQVIAATGAGSVNVAAHAVLHADGTVSVLLINRSANDLPVTITSPTTTTAAGTVTMTSPNGLTATSGFQIQGVGVSGNGSFIAPAPVPVPNAGGTVTITLSAYTATVLSLS